MGDAVNVMRHDRTALVLYGSETGNSQDVAEELGRMAERLHFATQVLDMDSADIVSSSTHQKKKGRAEKLIPIPRVH
jgi:sulfite reductase alpha subunit-like flavoprotein